MGKYTKEQKEHIAREFSESLVQQGLSMDEVIKLMEEFFILIKQGRQAEFNKIVELAIHKANSEGNESL
ncbi:hypothetical protein ACQVPP_27990 [Bacillus luti]|uniref:hypothetical protein n=1 Tax=Bacillus luti TaxID=2026191 RepID=UPI003D64BE5E